MELFFAADFAILGKVDQHELRPGGADIRVTEENKPEYLKYASPHFISIPLVSLSLSRCFLAHDLVQRFLNVFFP